MWQQQQPLSHAACREESLHFAALPHKCKGAESRSTDWTRSWHRFIRSSNPLVLWHREGVGVSGVLCSSPSPELPLKTDVCVKKASHLPNHQPQASFLVSSGLRIITAFVQYVLWPVVFSCPCTYAIEPPQSKNQTAKPYKMGEKRWTVKQRVLCSAGFTFQHQ